MCNKTDTRSGSNQKHAAKQILLQSKRQRHAIELISRISQSKHTMQHVLRRTKRQTKNKYIPKQQKRSEAPITNILNKTRTSDVQATTTCNKADDHEAPKSKEDKNTHIPDAKNNIQQTRDAKSAQTQQYSGSLQPAKPASPKTSNRLRFLVL